MSPPLVAAPLLLAWQAVLERLKSPPGRSAPPASASKLLPSPAPPPTPLALPRGSTAALTKMTQARWGAGAPGRCRAAAAARRRRSPYLRRAGLAALLPLRPPAVENHDGDNIYACPTCPYIYYIEKPVSGGAPPPRPNRCRRPRGGCWSFRARAPARRRPSPPAAHPPGAHCCVIAAAAAADHPGGAAEAQGGRASAGWGRGVEERGAHHG